MSNQLTPSQIYILEAQISSLNELTQLAESLSDLISTISYPPFYPDESCSNCDDPPLHSIIFRCKALKKYLLSHVDDLKINIKKGA